MLKYILPAIALLLSRNALAEIRPTVGWVEKVSILPVEIIVQGKLDTGAEVSSIDAHEITEFEKDNKKWVRFEVRSTYGKTVTLERPIRRSASIKRHNGKHEKRPVITMGICIGKVYMESEVNLVDRTNFAYQMLVGRNFLAGNLAIDPSQTFTVTPSCKKS